MKVGITVARINGLDKEPYYFDASAAFVWDINFSEVPSILINNLCFIYMGESKEEANLNYLKVLKNFQELNITENKLVAIIFDKNYNIIAIGNDNPYHQKWIDTRDEFKIKKFKELGIKSPNVSVFFLSPKSDDEEDNEAYQE